jgi:outer membrane protein assembly factor BamB
MVSLFLALAPLDASQWPRWRGPNENGLVDGNPPVEWSESKNVKWKTAIPGLGHATPILWNDRIYVQSAEQVSEGGLLTDAVYRFKLMAIDRKTGTIVWDKTLRESHPAEDSHHNTTTYASTSGLTDGEHLYAFFGSLGLYCLDFEGNVKWDKDLGDMRTKNSFGEGTSPTIHGNTLVVNWDHEGDSFIVAMDKRTGKELWRTDRDEITSWATPLVVEHKGVNQVIVPASGKTRSYDLATGKEIWECAGLGSNVIPTALHKDGIVYVMSGHRAPAMQAISLDKAKGDIAGTDAVLWSLSQNTPYVASPLLSGDRLYLMKGRNSILSCYNAKTGEPIYGPERLPAGVGHVYASLAGTDDHFYIPGLDGTTMVVKNSAEYEVLGANELDQGIAASPMISGGDLFLRTYTHLYCIAEEQ